ncbi:MAG: hypothetical protein LBT43_00995 [Prevotella sp.]|nr:hypothetical protein [Prevotella sp.]
MYKELKADSYFLDIASINSHSFRTIAAKKGIRDSIAERIMGHAEGNDIKDIYTHLHDEDIVREMLDKWIA